MGKRFTDTQIWEIDWFLDLSDRERSQFMYIKDRCDCIGVYKSSHRIESAVFGEAINADDLIAKCNGNLIRLDSAKLLLPDFCFFQYGPLNSSCRPHVRYIQEVKKAGLEEKIKGYPKGIDTLEEKEKEKETEKEKGGAGENTAAQVLEIWSEERRSAGLNPGAGKKSREAACEISLAIERAEISLMDIRSACKNLMRDPKARTIYTLQGLWSNYESWRGLGVQIAKQNAAAASVTFFEGDCKECGEHLASPQQGFHKCAKCGGRVLLK